MKTKLITTAILILCTSNFLFAQNPFESIGVKNIKVLTFSNGKFNEFFDNDTIVQIGSILFNTKSNEVIAFVKADTTYSEATLKPEITSRWLSPDPLASKYPFITPYNFVQNNPIISIDPDGRENIVVIGYGKDDSKHSYATEFVNTGFALAQSLAANAEGGEATSVLIYAPSDKDANYQYALSKFQGSGITVMRVSSGDEIVNYVNNREAGDNPEKNLITDFDYVGHARSDELLVSLGVNEGNGFLIASHFNNSAFSDNSNANLVGCRTAATTDLNEKETDNGQYTVTDFFAERLVGGTATGAPYDVYFGQSNTNSSSASPGSYYYQASSVKRGAKAGQTSPTVIPGRAHEMKSLTPLQPTEVKRTSE